MCLIGRRLKLSCKKQSLLFSFLCMSFNPLSLAYTKYGSEALKLHHSPLICPLRISSYETIRHIIKSDPSTF
ncbi:hypothetical protein KC19_12G076100 [Ceratodon purpureus]|uniref:Uncharacterized protein n=1 Tax=Ceratodon purpureus TaxID=3225 RepID=A0A8T0G741_CERPU|nr:hypothetical protein KC19_12G076100 [Ceratodon purpureus]